MRPRPCSRRPAPLWALPPSTTTKPSLLPTTKSARSARAPWSFAKWADLLFRLAINDDLRQRLHVKLCPISGQVEEYLVADQLGGMLNIWPEKWRGIIEAGRQVEAAC